MKAKIGQQIWRYARGITVLGFSVLGVAMIAQAVQRSTQGTAQVGHETHNRGEYMRDEYMFSDIPWTLVPAYAANGEETIEIPASPTPYTPVATKSNDIYRCFAFDPKFTRDVMVTGAEEIGRAHI